MIPGLVWRGAEGAEVPGGEEWLSSAERRALAGLRFPKRRADWRVGRWAAKRAVMGYLGEGVCGEWQAAGGGAFAVERAISIVAAADGAPEVVFAEGAGAVEVAVSISHSGGRGLAVAGPGGGVFGADLETIETRGVEFLDDVLTGRERAWALGLDERERAWGATLLWSVKEAALKALRVGLREDTRAVEVTVPVRAAPRGRGGAEGEPWHPVKAVVAGSGRKLAGVARVWDGQVVAILAGSGIGIR